MASRSSDMPDRKPEPSGERRGSAVPTVYPYVWSSQYYTHGEREGQRCRVWARGTMDSIAWSSRTGSVLSQRAAIREA
jgi:hypothetical protein